MKLVQVCLSTDKAVSAPEVPLHDLDSTPCTTQLAVMLIIMNWSREPGIFYIQDLVCKIRLATQLNNWNVILGRGRDRRSASKDKKSPGQVATSGSLHHFFSIQKS